MTRRLSPSLNIRLMAGLLAVTAAGLLVMGVVSALVLRGYLMSRVESQLIAARDRAPAALVRRGLPAQGVAPARYIVLNVLPDGQIRAPSGQDPSPAEAVSVVRRMDPAVLRGHAASGATFPLGGARAVARGGQRGNVVIVAMPLADVNAAVRRLVVTELATGIALIALLVLVSRWLIGRGLAPLSRMAATAHAIATGGDLRARMDGAGAATEVGRLARAINVMLDRIEQAFVGRLRSEAKVREFAADASHELRTPLTTIRGYAELFRQGAIAPDRLPETMRRIEDEAERMSRLVEELLELARLDRGAGLVTAPADLAEIVREAVADAATVEPDRPLAVDAPGSLVVVVDAARIRQILANLLTNVRAHTPPGIPATVRLARTGSLVVLEVSDDGPGMAPEDAARAFDRFHRAARTGHPGHPGHSGHSGDRDGSGLGLAIVGAIATAHGGRAHLRSSPGCGTTVRIDLPAPAPDRATARLGLLRGITEE